MSLAGNNSEAVFTQLQPKIIANHVSKIPGFEGLPYVDVLAMVGDPEVALADRLHSVAAFVGDITLTDELIAETRILELCATGREHEVPNPQRRESYAQSDANQQRDAISPHNLDFYLQNGVEIIFDRSARAQAQRYCELDTRDVPLIEKLKAQRLLDINGFGDSRVMYAVHDMIDHAWLFDQMRETGIMDRYGDFLTSIEMGDEAFLYSRQAELLASVGFGARRWDVAKGQGEQLIFKTTDLVNILQSRDDPRTAAAIAAMDDMTPDEQQQAVFMIENMAIQLTDERRRWGAVKQVSGQERKPMGLLDPVHVALMIETLHMLQRAEEYGKVQFEATVGVEKMLLNAINDPNGNDTLFIPIPRGDSTSVKGLTIVADHEAWLRHNTSVSTSYNKLG